MVKLNRSNKLLNIKLQKLRKLTSKYENIVVLQNKSTTTVRTNHVLYFPTDGEQKTELILLGMFPRFIATDWVL